MCIPSSEHSSQHTAGALEWRSSHCSRNAVCAFQCPILPTGEWTQPASQTGNSFKCLWQNTGRGTQKVQWADFRVVTAGFGK